MFEVKVGTPKPILFRECWNEKGFYMDLDLEARFAFACEVSDYDRTLYATEEDVTRAIKSNFLEILNKCLNEDWPENTSKVRRGFEGLGELFDKNMESYGIHIKSKFLSTALSPDSEEAFKIQMNLMVLMVQTQNITNGWDHIIMPPTNPYDIQMKEQTLQEIAKKMRINGSSEWTCPSCGTKNSSRFCEECGRAKPV